MNLEVVNIEDVYPNKNNPRKSFEGIDELSQSFDLNQERPGEPFIPPILVRDGGIYHIVDGERRYRAMKKRGLKKFTANVADNFDEANTLVAAMATDDKQPLSDLEKSRGVQQMLLLGVDPAQVDKAARVKSSRVSRAMRLVDDAAEDMTLDRLLAIEEFADDPAIVEKLTNCSEKEWGNIAWAARKDREDQQKRFEIEEALKARGYRVVSEKPEGYTYKGVVNKIKDVEKLTCDPSETAFIYQGYGTGYTHLGKPDESSDPEDTRSKEEIDKLRDEIEHLQYRATDWFVSMQPSFYQLYNTNELLKARVSRVFMREFNSFFEDREFDLNFVPSKYDYLYGFTLNRAHLKYYADVLIDFAKTGKCGYVNPESFQNEINLFNALSLDGFEMSEHEQSILKTMQEIVDWKIAND